MTTKVIWIKNPGSDICHAYDRNSRTGNSSICSDSDMSFKREEGAFPAAKLTSNVCPYCEGMVNCDPMYIEDASSYSPLDALADKINEQELAEVARASREWEAASEAREKSKLANARKQYPSTDDGYWGSRVSG